MCYALYEDKECRNAKSEVMRFKPLPHATCGLFTLEHCTNELLCQKEGHADRNFKSVVILKLELACGNS
jgi:hypothetical protein